MTKNILHSSKTTEWYTPPHLIELARKVMGKIDLDPASNNVAQKWIKAEKYYTIEDDGLTKIWTGNVWLNPPYGNGITTKWIDKLLEEYGSMVMPEAIILVRPAVSSRWFNTLAQNFVRCETLFRIRFIDANGTEQKSPAHGNVLFYVGKKNMGTFVEVFDRIGVISRPI
ncbi:DNA N-6-adenine-methyltransferase [Crocosphaera sp.]|uniref:DNA N-6-adenine-methyltransferase n=1 Tax=Crocosphaera sp. TaxID=2729996 RepID=UPI0026241C6A|nr:DNA N-6-adenine-methyltransferase [Crocosphaera sp.]MDJ0579059.1 DNA N-6-adenine-methyltransferase [Crocosphaera sp.]